MGRSPRKSKSPHNEKHVGCGTLELPIIALGFAFSASWEAVGDILGAVSLFAFGLLCVVVLIHRLLRYLKREKGMRQQEKLQVSEALPAAQKKRRS